MIAANAEINEFVAGAAGDLVSDHAFILVLRRDRRGSHLSPKITLGFQIFLNITLPFRKQVAVNGPLLKYRNQLLELAVSNARPGHPDKNARAGFDIDLGLNGVAPAVIVKPGEGHSRGQAMMLLVIMPD